MSDRFEGRREDLRLITGRGRYTADWSLPGQAHAAFLRSPHAHAEIAAIDVAAARSMPGVLLVLAGDDLAAAGYKPAPPGMAPPGRDGKPLKNPPRPTLARDRVRFVGELVAMVVAETEGQAQDAVERIEVDFRPLPALVGVKAAAAPGAPELHAEVAPGNVALEYEYGDEAAAAAAFAGAAKVARVEVEAQRIAGNPMEPKAGLAAYDPASGMYDVYVPSQGVSGHPRALAHITGEPPEKFRVHSRDVGGGFGVRGEVAPEYACLVLAARRLGRPVKWVGSRSETIVSDNHGRGSVMTGEMALDADGRFLAVRVEWLCDMGAYCSAVGPFINTNAAPKSTAVNVYRIPTVYGLSRLFFTNATPTTAYRGATRPQVSYLMERLVDEAARVTGLDPDEIRRRNFLAPDAFPYKTPTGSTYDSADPPGLLAAALEAADWAGFAARRAEAATRGKLRGIGLAVFIETSGAVGKEEIAVRFDGDGRINLFTNSGSSGMSHETTFPELVAAILGVGKDRIQLRWNDLESPPLQGFGSFGSRSMVSHGVALHQGAHAVIRQGMAHAADALEAAVADIEFADGTYRVAGTDRTIRFDALAQKLAGGGRHPLDLELAVDTANAWPSGAHVSEVEIDRDTGEIAILRYVAVDDCGKIYNHKVVEGQIVGGMMQGLGQVMGEQCYYDPETGQLLTASFMDYQMPRVDWLPQVSLYDRSLPSPNNPLGAKGVGEAGTTGSVPCVANAVMNALAPLGIRHLDTPFTPLKVWDAMQAAGKAGAER
ncbi:MAG TPA: xanthine dehydrogenase family protein molybdopterin-binding subunit [Hyphomicrobiales bacterium]|nr:xanthine dehydrogenase family protein molybdopterin-binding subunit [Hyphomicrobiales bacterium]